MFKTKPIEYVVELPQEEAEAFINDMRNPKPNPARDALLERARKFDVEIRG